MTLVLLALAAVQWAWGWSSPVLGVVAAELLLARWRRQLRRRQRDRRDAARARHRVVAWRRVEGLA